MHKFTVTNINEIAEEDAHGGSGKRQLLVKTENLVSDNLEAVTKAYLETGAVFDWHDHKDTDEIFIVLQGTGKFYFENKETEYTVGDIVTIPANSKHKIEATGEKTNEFYFIRVKV